MIPPCAVHPRAYRCDQCHHVWCLACHRPLTSVPVDRGAGFVSGADRTLTQIDAVTMRCSVCAVVVLRHPSPVTLPAHTKVFLAYRYAYSSRGVIAAAATHNRHDVRRYVVQLNQCLSFAVDMWIDDRPFEAVLALTEVVPLTVALKVLAAPYGTRRRWGESVLTEIAGTLRTFQTLHQVEMLVATREMMYPGQAVAVDSHGRAVAVRADHDQSIPVGTVVGVVVTDQGTRANVRFHSPRYLSLHTAEPEVMGGDEHEVSYAGYARAPHLGERTTFPAGVGGSAVVTHFAVRAHEYGDILQFGPIEPHIHVGTDVTPCVVVRTEVA